MIVPLSERELEVLRLMATGASNQEIAQELVIAVNTVTRHVRKIFDKLAAKDNTDQRTAIAGRFKQQAVQRDVRIPGLDAGRPGILSD